nr:hypothetical protein [uncultured Dongia sp.]
MYSESDLESAVAAGAITSDAAEALRNHVAAQRSTVLVDEESFRLLSGFNDIFVVIASILLLTALGWIGSSVAPMIGAALVATASWGLAEFFTRKRRMALPSIVLLLTFACGVAGTVAGVVDLLMPSRDGRGEALIGAGTALITAIAIWLHWRRFRVPITVAVGGVSLVCLLAALILAIDPLLILQLNWIALLGGLCLFAFAMWWDISDRVRQTRRSDVAFWLHLAAAPMIAHSIFYALGVFAGRIDTPQAAMIVAFYIFLAGVSLAIDRRALLVSSLAYVLYAISTLFKDFGAVSLNLALTGLVIGSALLLLSAFWHPARRAVLRMLPVSWRDRLPVLDRPAAVSSNTRQTAVF